MTLSQIAGALILLAVFGGFFGATAHAISMTGLTVLGLFLLGVAA